MRSENETKGSFLLYSIGNAYLKNKITIILKLQDLPVKKKKKLNYQFSLVQLLSHVRHFVTP